MMTKVVAAATTGETAARLGPTTSCSSRVAGGGSADGSHWSSLARVLGRCSFSGQDLIAPNNNHKGHQDGREVVLWGRTEETLRTTCAEVRQAGSDCWYFVCDVADRHAVYRQAQVTRQKVGEVTVLVNNAGVVAGHSLLNIDDEALLSTEHVNVLGHFWTLKAFLPSMLSCGHGHVVCVSSVLALTALPGAIDYCTSKAAAFGLMESLSLGLESTPGVRTTTVLPYLTDTDMFRGVKPRFSWLFPPLHAELVARRTVEAVKRDEAVVFMPRSMVLLVLMKSLLPQAAVDEIYRFMGNYTCMNSLHVQS
uniref:Short-chain dehydrogenase/reductase 3 n=1 Tax=Eptatretus burgeri TaxID=7764 RepID=A0A8C4Q1D3_EPTBU